MLVLVRLVLGVDRHRNGTNLDGSEKGVKKFRRVQKQEQYALFALDTQTPQSISDTIRSLQQLQVADALIPAFNGYTLRSSLVDIAINEVGRGVESVRQGNHDGSLRCAAVNGIVLAKSAGV